MINISNSIGDKGEKIAKKLMPSAQLVRTTGYDLIGLAGEKIEVKTSRFNKKRGGWRFQLSRPQVLICDYVLLLALSPKGTLCSYWLIPGDDLRSKEININELNLANFAKYLVEVRN